MQTAALFSGPPRQWHLPEPPHSDHTTAQEYAYARLRYAILVGGVPPGVALTIRGIATELSLSPTPVRESLKRLCSEGALLLQSNRRIITPPMTPARHQELISTRIALEQLAVRHAIPFITDNDIDQLLAIDLQMDQAILDQDYILLVTLNQQFHSTLYALNPEQVCLPMIESVWLQLGPYNRVAAELAGELTMEDWHKHLLQALRQRDPELAAEAVASDINQSSDSQLRAVVTKP
ncbi:MAG: GntR family transcriptional regulator [Granulosicoccaceae bacterium]